ncbi:MAG: D-alanyl-D-alanine carboxypeptidase [Lachnospira sp.]|nr:D-alanyl-D-alanine carboxypeptidase [Lachnospira sp.]
MKRKWITIAMVLVMSVMHLVMPVTAAQYEKSNGVEEEYLQTEAKVPKMYSEAAILMDAKTGEILFQKNGKKKEYPASITKCLTSLIAIEHNNLQDMITFSEDAIYDVDVGSSSIARDVGEELTVEQTLYGAMLESANECCNAIAEKTAGSKAGFADMMNQKAEELGCVNSHFSNPSGLYDKNHYTCVYDMALIVKAGLANDNWRRFSSELIYEIPPTNKKDDSTFCRNHHSMVNGDVPYDNTYYTVEGGKTGYTVKCKNTLITYAKSNTTGMELIAVVMRCDDYYYVNGHSRSRVYTDTENLFQYGFSNFKVITSAVDFSGKEDVAEDSYIKRTYQLLQPEKFISFSAENDCKIVVSNNYDESSLLGTLVFDGDIEKKRWGVYEFISSGNVIASTDVYYSLNQDVIKDLFVISNKQANMNRIGQILLCVVIAVILLLLVIGLVKFVHTYSLLSIMGRSRGLGTLNPKKAMSSFKPYKKRRSKSKGDYGKFSIRRHHRHRRYSRKHKLHF